MLRLHPLHALVRRSGGAIATALRSSHFETPTAGRRLEHLSWRSERDQRVGQGLFCAETRRLLCGRAVYAGGARRDHASRWYSANEHFQQTLPGIARPVSMEIFAGHPVGNGASAELVAVSHLQNVVVEPGHDHPSRHHQSFQTNPASAWRKTTARALPTWYRAKRFAAPSQRKVLDLAKFLSPARRHL